MKRALLMALLLTACTSKTEAPIYKYDMGKGAGTLGIHSVQTGDTPYKISQKYNLDLRELIETNHLSPPYKLQLGTRLKLPAPQTYTVRNKDSLYTISRLFNTTQTDLVRLNNLKAPYNLASGQTLKIPKIYGSNEPDVQEMPEPVIAQPVSIPPVVEVTALPPTVSEVSAPQPDAAKTEPEIKTAASLPQQPAKSSPQTAPVSTGKFIKPVNGKVISSYGPKKDGQHNDGINIQAAKGDPVRAADGGQVVYVGQEIAGYGNMILLRHQNKYITAYAHLNKALVKKGDTVMRGQTIGTVGQTGFVDTPQLHFEIRQGKSALDPARLI